MKRIAAEECLYWHRFSLFSPLNARSSFPFSPSMTVNCDRFPFRCAPAIKDTEKLNLVERHIINEITLIIDNIFFYFSNVYPAFMKDGDEKRRKYLIKVSTWVDSCVRNGTKKSLSIFSWVLFIAKMLQVNILRQHNESCECSKSTKSIPLVGLFLLMAILYFFRSSISRN